VKSLFLLFLLKGVCKNWIKNDNFERNKKTAVMQSIEGNKLIIKLQKDLLKNGLKLEALVKGLKELRPYAIEEEDPTLTKVIRLTYEHIENNKTFDIAIPGDEELNEDAEEAVVIANQIETEQDRVDSVEYLLSLMLDRENSSNKQDMFEYRDALKAY